MNFMFLHKYLKMWRNVSKIWHQVSQIWRDSDIARLWCVFLSPREQGERGVILGLVALSFIGSMRWWWG